jgi:hypothetical protein
MKSSTKHFLNLISLLFFSLSFQTNVSAQATVVIAGDFQSEIGCPGDWMPDCDATRLMQTSPGIWEGTFNIPAGAWQYKVAYDNSWNENYGEGGVPGGANMWLVISSPTAVHFTYSAVTHLVNLSFISPGVSLAGDFQSELGCPGDWIPDCGATSLFYDAQANIWYGIFAIPPGSWQYKITINGSWAENYGLGGVLNGPNIPLVVSGDKKILFRYDPNTHLVTTTPINYSVTLAGDFQTELGCPGDWQPDCPMTGLALDAGSNLWKGNFLVPAGNWQFKVTLDGSWVENYGEGGVLNGPNILLNLPATSKVTFIYNPETHIVKYEIESVTVVIPGSFQTELGCATDWDPACDNTRLTYDEVKRMWTGTFDIPAGTWEYKVALNNSWGENYGEGGIPGGANIFLNLPTPANITFNYDPQSHIVTLVFNTTALCASAFYDANANGFKDYFEDVSMAGVAINLLGQGTQYTGGDGITCFGGLAPGAYTMRAALPPGYLPTTPDSQTVALGQPQTLNFGMVCLGGAGAKNLAFWVHKKGKAVFDSLQWWQQDYILSVLRYLNLRDSEGRDFDPWDYEELRGWLQRANAKNMAYKLSAQMAVLLLNAEVKMLGNRTIKTPGIHFLGIDYNFMNVSLFILYINQQLFSNSFGGDPNRAAHQFLYDVAEQANNDMIFVQLQPCGSTLTTSAKTVPEQQVGLNTSPLAVKAWPNPSSNHFNLRLEHNTGKGNIQVRVLDVQGRQVFTTTGAPHQNYRFVEHFLPGLYIIEVIQGSNRTNQKVIKQ